MYAIIGLDLSFNSTGICCSVVDENNYAKKMMFARVVSESHHSKKIPLNVNVFEYSLPQTMTADSLILTSEDEDKNTHEQLESTLKALKSSKMIYEIVHSFIVENKPITRLVVCIENYIMPAFGGQNALANVSGLITLQAYIREYFIKYSSHNNIDLKMITPSPTSVKKMFSGNGRAEKSDMMRSFLDKYNGQVLLPTASLKNVDVLNDVIDAFAMNTFAYYKIVKNPEILKIPEI